MASQNDDTQYEEFGVLEESKEIEGFDLDMSLAPSF